MGGEVAREAAKAVQPQPHRCPVGADVDPVDQQPDDARPLGGEELVPQWLALLQRRQDLALRVCL